MVVQPEKASRRRWKNLITVKDRVRTEPLTSVLTSGPRWQRLVNTVREEGHRLCLGLGSAFLMERSSLALTILTAALFMAQVKSYQTSGAI